MHGLEAIEDGSDTEGFYGDYRTGRWGWVLGNVRRLPEPVPWKGSQGLRAAPSELVEACLAGSR